MPPRKGKRKFDQEDELDKAEATSKWAAVLQQDDQEEQQQMPKKEIFKFDFSKEHLLLNQKDPPKKQEPKIELTPQEREQLQRRLEKQRKQREIKEKIRRQKKLQRKKQLDKQKQEEKAKREQQEKEQQQLQKVLQSNKSKSGDTKRIFYFLIILGILLGTLQYQKDIYVKLSKFRLDTQVNYYEVLETKSGVTEAQLKAQYKKLVLKYHPDKNPNCHTCKDKFDSIMQAWEVLGNPQKRQSYDQSSGYINQIPSETLTLNSQNYKYLLGDSDDIWIVQVYDSTSQYCHYFAKFWQDLHETYKGLVNFGRIDVWQQSQMKSFIPYNYQLFPGLYTVHRGQEKLCQVDFDRPHKSIDFCIEQQVRDAQFTKIRDWSQIKENTGRKAVIIGGGIKLGTRMKLVNSKFSRYYDYYVMENSQKNVQVRGSDHKFNYSSYQNSKKLYQKYAQFLQSGIIQQRSFCEIQVNCKLQPCILLIEKDFKHEQLLNYPVYSIKEEAAFQHKIQQIKNMTGLHERFQLGLYQDGKLQLGNFDQIDDLHPESGEVIDFPCVASTWTRTLIKLIRELIPQ